MRYYEISKVLKEDGDAAPAADAGVTTSAAIATVVTPLGTPDKKKKAKPVVIKRNL